MKKYQLLNKHGVGVMIFISECAKQDFMDLMGWSEWEFSRHTQLKQGSQLK